MPRKPAKKNRVAATTQSAWNKSYFLKEQQVFYKLHPQANLFISFFLLAYFLFLVVYFFMHPEIMTIFVY